MPPCLPFVKKQSCPMSRPNRNVRLLSLIDDVRLRECFRPLQAQGVDLRLQGATCARWLRSVLLPMCCAR